MKLNPRERGLFILIVAIVFVVANVMVGTQLLKKKRAIERERHQLSLTRIEMESLLESGANWEDRRDWIDAAQPRFENPQAVETELLEAADAAVDFQIKVVHKDLLEIERTEQIVQAGIWLSVEGTLENVLRWLYDLQQPEKFRVVRKLQLAPDADDLSGVKCEFLLLRWYRSESS